MRETASPRSKKRCRLRDDPAAVVAAHATFAAAWAQVATTTSYQAPGTDGHRGGYRIGLPPVTATRAPET